MFNEKIKLKKLKEYLQDIETFISPKEYYEQYQTNFEVAAELIHYINNNHGFENKIVADLGCGTGILGIGCLLCGAEEVTFYDIDKDAIEQLKENLEFYDLQERAQIVNVDIFDLNMNNEGRKEKPFDYIITNPPFGVQSKNSADIIFLEKALELGNSIIFSMHKANTFDYIKKFYDKRQVKNIIKHDIDFDLPKTYKFHKENNKVIKVACIEALIN